MTTTLINKDLEQEIIQWHIKTFPKATLDSQVLKWQEEYQELNKADDYRSYVNELADCIIVATAFKRFREVGNTINEIFNKCFISILDNKKNNWDLDYKIIERFVKNKLEINKTRTWEFVDGVYRHVEVFKED